MPNLRQIGVHQAPPRIPRRPSARLLDGSPGETPRGTGKEKARDDLVAVVIEALKAGERPTDVTAWSPFTAAYVRKIARAHGIEAPGHSRGEA
jgi:hypothetical protein